jgi:hypothetical protein
MYPLPVNQFCGHQYVQQSISSPSTSFVVINMSNNVPPPRQPVLWSSICRTKYLLPVNQFCSHQYVEQITSSPSTSSVVINMSSKVPPPNRLTGRRYFVRHIDDYRNGWRGEGTLFDILMSTELVDGKGVLCSTYWWLQNWLMDPLPVNQFCSHQYVEQRTPSPSTSSVVINMSNKVPPPRQPVL